ncbi:zinc finger SWIM domain-containing protein 3-like [Palaemon carinicauda]|uniref:zinc finger SWIM domain-containing protein 3-like n=1 Tax=Palaemon carinicauda TaxID=392227 RepID=UPI0035B5D477
MNTTDITVGSTFPTFSDFKSAFDLYQLRTGSVFTVRDTKSVTSANKKISNASKHYPISHRFRFAKYVCKHYGTEVKRSGSGIRPNQSTYHTGCTAFMKLTSDRSTGMLTILALQDLHSHPLHDPALYPERRRLDSSSRKEAERLCTLGVAASTIKSYFADNLGKTLTLRDIYNIRAQVKRNQANDKSDIGQLWQVLSELFETDKKSVVSTLVDDENELEVLFIQTGNMIKAFESYHKVLIIDKTYVTFLRMPLFSLVAVDGDGAGQVVAYALIWSDNNEVIKSALELFTHANPATSKLQTVMVDKDMLEISSLCDIFPQARVIICHYHVLKAFNKAVSDHVSDPDQKITLNRLLEHMVYSCSEEDFNRYYHEMCDVSKDFLEYFDGHWLSIKDCWAGYTVSHMHHLGNLSIESHNNRLKMVVNDSESLASLVSSLLASNEDNLTESTTFSSRVQAKRQYSAASGLSTEIMQDVRATCTPYAAKLVKRELEEAYLGGYEITEDGVSKDDESYITDDKTCDCQFACKTGLPCRHVFVWREQSGAGIFSVNDIPTKWRLSSQEASENGMQCQRVPKTKRQKYDVASNVCNEIAELVSSQGHKKFCQKLEVLQRVLNLWQDDKLVDVVAV